MQLCGSTSAFQCYLSISKISRKKRSACHTGRCFEHAGVAARSLSEKQKHFARQVGSKLLSQLDFINSSLNSLSAWFLCPEILVHDFWLLDCLPGLEWGLQMDQAAGSWDLEVVLVLVLVLVEVEEEEEEVEVSVCHACSVLKLGSAAPQWSNHLNSVSYFWLPMLHPPCPLACTTWGWLGLLDFKKTKWALTLWLECEMNGFELSYSNFSNPAMLGAWCYLMLLYLMLIDANWCLMMLGTSEIFDLRKLVKLAEVWRIHRTSKFNRQMLHGSIKALQIYKYPHHGWTFSQIHTVYTRTCVHMNTHTQIHVYI